MDYLTKIKKLKQVKDNQLKTGAKGATRTRINQIDAPALDLSLQRNKPMHQRILLLTHFDECI